MFTGIIEEIGVVKNFKNSREVISIEIQCYKVLDRTQIGDSISTNGVCLTVSSIGINYFKADIMKETLRRSNLGNSQIGTKVNLERAMSMKGRFGGHIVSGHIDGEGKIVSYHKEKNAVWITISAEERILKYIVEKGSIAIDGVSLTVAYVDEKCFKVSIIPHTGEETTLTEKKSGELVNLECDVIGKYAEKLLVINNLVKYRESAITREFLLNNGF